MRAALTMACGIYFIILSFAINVMAQNTNEACSYSNHECLFEKLSEISGFILDIPARINTCTRHPFNTALCQIVHDSSCFVVIPKKMIWQDAFEHCALLGGRLAEVHSSLLHAKMQELVAGLDNLPFYLGGTDAEEEGSWIWATSRRALNDGFVDWNPGQPDGGSQDCLIIHASNDGVGWHDVICQSAERIPLCEFVLN